MVYRYYFRPLNDPLSKLKAVIDASVNHEGSVSIIDSKVYTYTKNPVGPRCSELGGGWNSSNP